MSLSARCDLNQLIRIAPKTEDFIQLAMQRNDSQESITVRELLQSWGELDYVRKARAALGVPNVGQNLELSGMDAGSSPLGLAAASPKVES